MLWRNCMHVPPTSTGTSTTTLAANAHGPDLPIEVAGAAVTGGAGDYAE